MIKKESTTALVEFLQADDNMQRNLFDEKANDKKAQMVIRGFFDVIQNVKAMDMLIQYCLAHLDGILEDSRDRIHHFIDVQNHFKTPLNLISILNSFIHQNNNDDRLQRDIASHILALMIEAEKYEKCEKPAKEFLMYLMQQRDISGMLLNH